MFHEKSLSRSVRLAFGSALGLALMSTSAWGQDVQKAEKVEITGSSIKRIDTESALPVTVIKKEDIEKLGVSTAAELLDRVSANNGQGYNTALALGDAARPGFSGPSLRGLGPNNTLLLLNGRRLAVYAFDGGAANLNAIPIAAVERVEILRDGASAVYGTDAIGGVINFITRKDFVGGEINLGYSQPEAKGGVNQTGTATFGFGDLAKNGFNVFGMVDYRKLDAIHADQRDFSKTAYIPALGVNRLSSNSVPSNISTSSGLVNPYANKYNGGSGCLPPASFGTSATDARCRFDYASVIDIVNPAEMKNVLLHGTFQVNGSLQLFAEYARSENKYTFKISPDPVSEATTFNGDPVLYPKTGKYYPGNGITPAFPAGSGVVVDSGGYPGYADLYWRSLAAGPRTDVAKETNDRFLIGAEGTLLGWDYNLGLMRATSKVTDSYTDGWLSESKLLRTGGLTPTDPGYSAAVLAAGGIDPNINPFSITQDAAGTAALNAAKVTGVVRSSKSTRDTFDAHASREIFNLPAGAVALAIGTELRKDEYNDNPLPVLSSGDLIGSGGNQQPVKGSRKLDAAFAEIEVPILKNLEGNVALRYDHYSDFGNTTNPKVSLRWQPMPELLFRGSAGTGFRAPTLPDLYAPQSQTNSGGAYDDPLYNNSNGTNNRCVTQFNGQYCNAQLKIKQGGFPGLDPEKSKQFTLGFLVQPTRDLSFGVDYFYIYQKELIGTISGDTKLLDYIAKFNPATNTSSSVYAGDIKTKVDAVTGATVIDYTSSQTQNVGEQITQGVDLSFSYKFPKMEAGDFKLNFEGTYFTSQKSRLKGQTDYSTDIGLYAAFGPVARFKHVTTLGWDRGPWTASVNYNYVSGYQDQTTPHVVGAYETFDTTVLYTGFKNIKLQLGIRNLLDRNPPISNQNSYFQVGYDPTYSDPHGRTYYGRASYSFK